MIRLVPVRRHWLASLFALGLGLVSILPSVPAQAQCDLTQAPYQFAPPQLFPKMGLRATVFSLNLAEDRSTPMLSIKYNYGFMTWDLVNGTPAPGAWTLKDLRDAPEKYPVSGDSGGRSGETVLSTDGARALTGWNDPGFGVVAMTQVSNGYSGGGDYPPGGSANAVVKLDGPRYLAVSGNSVGSIYVADVTTLQTSVPARPANSIPSELARRMDGTWATLRVKAIEGGSRTFVGVSTVRGVAIGEMRLPGAAVPNLSTNFIWYEFSAAALGLPADKKLRWAEFAVHPVDGGVYILAEAYTGGTLGDYAVAVSLSRMTPETGALEVKGVYTPASSTLGWPQGALVESDSGLLAFFLHNPPGSAVAQLHVRPSGSTFATENLAQGASWTAWSVPKIDDFRVQNYALGKYALYLANTDYIEAAQVTCAQGPTPAVAALKVRTVSRTGITVEVPDNGNAFLGDKLRVEPSFSPSTQVLLDWGLDYNYHGLGSLDYRASVPNLAQADVSGTGPSVPLSQYTVYGPCDSRAGGTPADGTACWTSVTTNSTQTTGAPPAADFPPAPAAGFSKQLKIAFEVRNALNPAGTSSIAEHRINWNVPAARVKSTAILSGGIVTDDSEGSPIPTGYKWYFSSAKVGDAGADVLTLRTSCTGNTCNPALSVSGSYRYWVTASYDGGFATPACPGLSGDGQTCGGDALKTVSVTDVVLGFTVPGTVYVGTGTFSVPSSSLKGAVEGCDGVSGFSYDLCSGSGVACTEGDYSGSGLALSGDPFAGGSLLIPKPAEGTWGIRIRYQFAPAGGCANKSTAKWPADGSAAPVVVSRTLPTIHLTNSSGVALCQYHPIYGETCSIETGLTGKAYAYVDGVQDPAPPAITWTFGSGPTKTGQGATFSYTTAGTYTVTLDGYGSPVARQISVSAPPVVVDPLGVSSFSVSNQSPTTGTTVTFSCSATGGTPPYQYRFDYGDGQNRGFSSSSTAYHAYSTAGTYYAFCQISDAALNSGQSSARVVTVTQGGGGVPSACSLSVKDAQQGLDLQLGMGNKYYVNSGQLIRLEATDVTTTVNWAYGDGRTDSGTPKTFSYTNLSGAAVDYTLTMTSGASCTVARNFNVSPATGPDFGVYGVVGETETPVVWDTQRSAFSVSSGQMLRFKATGATGAVSWAFGDNTSSTETNATKVYTEPVDKLHVVTLTADGKTKTKNVFVMGSTGAPLTGAYSFAYADGKAVNPSIVEANKPIRFTAADNADTYTWDFGDGPVVQGSPKEHSFTRGGNYIVKLTTGRTGVTPVTTPSPTTFTVKETDPLLWVAGGMVYADGQSGERWQSDLSIFNPGSLPADVSLAFISGSGWAGATGAVWKKLTLAPGQTMASKNVLADFFWQEKGAWGVVLVRSDSGPTPPVIVSRTYNAADGETKGTFGLSVPAMSVSSGVKPASAASGGNFLADLRHDASFRTNLTVANLKDETAEVEFVFRDVAGNVLGSPARVTVEARGVKQIGSALVAAVAGAGGIGGAGFTGTAAHFSAEVIIKSGSGVYPYATVIDAGTGDSIVVTPAPRPSPTYRLPGIVRVKGKTDKYWVSDVAILNPGATERKVMVTYSYVKSGSTKRASLSGPITLGAYKMVVLKDFVKEWLELSADDSNGYVSSYVDVTPDTDDLSPAEPLIVTGKTYTPSGAGSVGLQVDSFVFEDGASEQGSRRKLVLSGLEASLKYRTNVALFLTPGSTGGVQVDVRVLNSSGLESKKIPFVGLDPSNPFVQFNSSDLFAGLTTDEVSRATVVIDNPRGTGLVGAYATIIDNLSDDATFVAGQLVP